VPLGVPHNALRFLTTARAPRNLSPPPRAIPRFARVRKLTSANLNLDVAVQKLLDCVVIDYSTRFIGDYASLHLLPSRSSPARPTRRRLQSCSRCWTSDQPCAVSAFNNARLQLLLWCSVALLVAKARCDRKPERKQSAHTLRSCSTIVFDTHQNAQASFLELQAAQPLKLYRSTA